MVLMSETRDFSSEKMLVSETGGAGIGEVPGPQLGTESVRLNLKGSENAAAAADLSEASESANAAMSNLATRSTGFAPSSAMLAAAGFVSAVAFTFTSVGFLPDSTMA